MKAGALFDEPGPITRRRVRIGSAIASILVLAVIFVIYSRLADKGQFDPDKWTPLVEADGIFTFIAVGIANTLLAAALALVFALPLGIAVAVGRLSQHRWIRVTCTAYVEFFRGAPVLLLMLFYFLAFPILFGIALPPLWTVVLALTLFHGAVICEIVRAGVLTLPRGQSEAASAIGMRPLQMLRLILLPQALKIMLPTLISQFVILVKDTSLGFLVNYQDLLYRSDKVQLLFANPLQTFIVTAGIYILINSGVSALSHWVSNRQRSTARAGAPEPTMPAVAQEVEVGAE